MAKIAFFSTQVYDKKYFEKLNTEHTLEYFETRLNVKTADLAKGYDGVCVFVNDNLDEPTLKKLKQLGVGLVALRSAGFNNVDIDAACHMDMRVLRVPAYSPEAVAEHAVALLLTLCRKTHKAYNRVREGNFSLVRLNGFNISGKTTGVIGTGKIGQVFCRIMQGFNSRVIAYDKYPSQEMMDKGVEYLDFEQVLQQSDILSLHCPLTPETHHIINAESIAKMKPQAILINTSRGKLVHTVAVIDGLRSEHLGGVAIDVYEQEENLFFRDLSEMIIRDDQISRLLAFPNVLITSHQGFFTNESMEQITQTTLQNFSDYENHKDSANEVTCDMLK
ncbi:MAG: 2-hydroxyacid dehydrogenase [Bacteroidales bacterium]